MKCCQKWILIGALVIGRLYGEEESSALLSINSGEAEYNGRELSLFGDVVVQHDLGTISAHRFTISPSRKSKKQRFSNLDISDEVVIAFKEGGRLTCERAKVDYENLYGIFFGTPEKPDVVYVHGEKEANLSTHSDEGLTVKGDQLQVKFRGPQADATGEVVLNQMQMDGHVRVDYYQDYHLKADQALFQPASLHQADLLAGHLILIALQPAYCEAVNSKGDHIQAKKITIDTMQHQMILSDVRGTICQQSAGDQKWHFSADQLFGDEKEQSFTLSGHVQANDHGHLQLKTDHQLIINYRTVNGKREIQTIKAPQDTEVGYLNEKNETVHKALCYGDFLLDHAHAQIWMHSPKDSQGRVLEGKQVFFENLMGEMCADQVQFLFTSSEPSFPSKIVLTGNVQIFNRFDGHVQESGSVLQYALADQVEYVPDAQEMLLTGLNGNRVLFFDKINSLQMSAPALKIHLEKTTHKESIQGIGDVRFTFIEREFNQLKERFRFR